MAYGEGANVSSEAFCTPASRLSSVGVVGSGRLAEPTVENGLTQPFGER
jgi:hypothetical protein